MGFVQTRTGEFCIAAHILVPPAEITNDFRQPQEGSSVLVYNEHYPPSGAPRRDRWTWGEGIMTLLKEGGYMTPLRTSHIPDMAVVFPAQDRDLWEVTRPIEDFINLPTRALFQPCSSLVDFVQTRSALREELYAVGGNIRETLSYKRELREQKEQLLSYLGFDVHEAEARWQHVRTYFPVDRDVRFDMWLAFRTQNYAAVPRLLEKVR